MTISQRTAQECIKENRECPLGGKQITFQSKQCTALSLDQLKYPTCSQEIRHKIFKIQNKAQ